MKIKAFLLTLIGIISCGKVFATGFSNTNDAIYLAISGSTTNELVQFDDSLVWHPFCTHGQFELNYPNQSYGFKIKMTDAAGEEIDKTKLGKTFGGKFDEVHGYQDVVPPSNPGYNEGHIGSIVAAGAYDAKQEVSGPILPAPKDLFRIDKPGTYILQIETQMFLIHKSTAQWTRELIRFSPITIKVIKPPKN